MKGLGRQKLFRARKCHRTKPFNFCLQVDVIPGLENKYFLTTVHGRQWSAAE